MTPQTVLDFWFTEENHPFQFARNNGFDAQIALNFSISGSRQLAANFHTGAILCKAGSPKSLFLTNSRAICSATALKRLPKILLHSFLPKKPFANPASPTSFRMNAISC